MGFNVMRGAATDMPALRKRKSPGAAAVIGFLFGGIGLGLYLWSFVDFVVPIAIVLLAGAALKAAGFLAGAVIASVWGYFRALYSNNKLDGKA
jgi:hypothetical protein